MPLALFVTYHLRYCILFNSNPATLLWFLLGYPCSTVRYARLPISVDNNDNDVAFERWWWWKLRWRWIWWKWRVFSGTKPPNQMIHGHLSIAVAMQPQRQFTLKLKLFFFLGYPCSTVTPHARLHPTPTDLFIESLSAPSRVFLQNLQLVIRCVWPMLSRPITTDPHLRCWDPHVTHS